MRLGGGDHRLIGVVRLDDGLGQSAEGITPDDAESNGPGRAHGQLLTRRFVYADATASVFGLGS